MPLWGHLDRGQGSTLAGRTRPDKPWRRPGAVRYALRRVMGLLRPPVDVYEPEPGSLTMLRDLPVTVRDGTTLRVNVVCRRGRAVSGAAVGASLWQGQPAAAGPDRVPGVGAVPDAAAAGRVRFSSLTGWEEPDPAWWAAQGYAVVNCDLRGAGTSEGTASLLSDQEGEDIYDLVEWAGAQSWSTGAVGMLGVSYLALSQWKTAALRPPSLQGDLSVGGLHGRVPGPDTPWRHPRGRLHQALEPRAARRPAAVQHRR